VRAANGVMGGKCGFGDTLTGLRGKRLITVKAEEEWKGPWGVQMHVM